MYIILYLYYIYYIVYIHNRTHTYTYLYRDTKLPWYQSTSPRSGVPFIMKAGKGAGMFLYVFVFFCVRFVVLFGFVCSSKLISKLLVYIYIVFGFCWHFFDFRKVYLKKKQPSITTCETWSWAWNASFHKVNDVNDIRFGFILEDIGNLKYALEHQILSIWGFCKFLDVNL